MADISNNYTDFKLHIMWAFLCTINKSISHYFRIPLLLLIGAQKAIKNKKKSNYTKSKLQTNHKIKNGMN